jgi:hypothetical protein
MQNLESINFAKALEGVTEHWSPKIIGRVNDQYVKVAKGESACFTPANACTGCAGRG